MNEKLKKITHLVKVVPITFPHGLPQDESDFHHCILHQDGRLEVKKQLQPLEKRLTVGVSEKDKLWNMSSETIEKSTTKTKEKFALSQEYFPAVYIYKHNQDGKEFRYFGNDNIGGHRTWW